MSGSCHGPVDLPIGRPDGEIVIALAGNPNVGKSTVFNAMTGLGVLTAHYPGTTQEVQAATATAGERTIGVIDLPGAYGLDGDAEESRVARQALRDLAPDVVVVVVDPSTLARTLYLALEVLDLGHRVVLAVNLADEAERAGIVVDVAALEAALGVRAVLTVATQGVGVSEVVDACFAATAADRPAPLAYSPDFEALIEPLIRACENLECQLEGTTARASALTLLEGSGDQPEPEIADEFARVSTAIRSHFGETAAVKLARERHGLAGMIGQDAVSRAEVPVRKLPRNLWSLTTWPWTGVPLVVLVAASIFGFLFWVGAALAGAFAFVWETFASPVITGAIEALVGTGVWSRVLHWGFDAGIEAALSVGLPYILTFYVLLGLLEDTGYLNSLAFLTDRLMHRLGLHGRAIVPLVAAAGCNVPALVAAGALPSKRERLIASSLVLFVPCSARTAVILGAVGAYVGWQATLIVLGVVFALWLGIGLTLERMLPGHSEGLVMEMFPFRRPSLKRVLAKAWDQFREFLFVATPIVVVGSLVLGGLYESGWLVKVAAPIEPVMEVWLGLPAVAGLTLLLGFLRKELSLQLLVALAVATAGFAGAELTDLMSRADLIVFVLVNTIALPCISSVAVYWRRHGIRLTVAMLAASIALALLIGGIAARVLPLVGIA